MVVRLVASYFTYFHPGDSSFSYQLPGRMVNHLTAHLKTDMEPENQPQKLKEQHLQRFFLGGVHSCVCVFFTVNVYTIELIR